MRFVHVLATVCLYNVSSYVDIGCAGRGNQRKKVGSESGENTIDLFYLINI